MATTPNLPNPSVSELKIVLSDAVNRSEAIMTPHVLADLLATAVIAEYGSFGYAPENVLDYFSDRISQDGRVSTSSITFARSQVGFAAEALRGAITSLQILAGDTDVAEPGHEVSVPTGLSSRENFISAGMPHVGLAAEAVAWEMYFRDTTPVEGQSIGDVVRAILTKVNDTAERGELGILVGSNYVAPEDLQHQH